MYRIRNTVSSLMGRSTACNDDEKSEVYLLNDWWTEKDLAKHICMNIKDTMTCENNRTFTILNIKHLTEQVSKWQKWLPRVIPFYAVKCSNSNIVLEILASLGMNFDCASYNEIKQVLSIGVSSSRILFAHTAKPISSIQYAKTNGINTLTFDSDIELIKIKQHHPTARLLIRIRSDSQTAVNILGNKFGCSSINEAALLLQIAKELKLKVVGVCFHVGSLCNDTKAYIKGIEISKKLFQIGSELGFEMTVVDIGGGFPGDCDVKMETMAKEINAALDKYFPQDESTQIIAEPGRFFVSSAFTLACLVHSARRPISMIKNSKECNEVYFNKTSNKENELKKDINNAPSTNETENDNCRNNLNKMEDNEMKENGEESNTEDIVIGCDKLYEEINEFTEETDNCKNNDRIMYFMDNGIYTSFAGVLWKRLVIEPEPLESLPGPNIPCSLWGPTCDGRDMICARISLPQLPVPSWLLFPKFGAYTCTTSTNFNGYPKPLLFAFVHNSFREYFQQLTHIKQRNVIKWVEIADTDTVKTIICKDSMQFSIPSHLPIEELYKEMKKSEHQHITNTVIESFGLSDTPNQSIKSPKNSCDGILQANTSSNTSPHSFLIKSPQWDAAKVGRLSNKMPYGTPKENIASASKAVSSPNVEMEEQNESFSSLMDSMECETVQNPVSQEGFKYTFGQNFENDIDSQFRDDETM